MKISINAVLEHCRLCYFRYFLQLTLELVLIFFIFIGTQKKMLLVLSLVPVLKQWSNILVNEEIQTNRDQKLNLLLLQWHDHSWKFWIKVVKNWQKNITKGLIFTTMDT